MLDAHHTPTDLEAEARGLLDRGHNLHGMIRDRASLMLRHLEAGNDKRAAEYADEIHALQRIDYEHRTHPNWLKNHPFSDCDQPKILTLKAWGRHLMQAPLVQRDAADRVPCPFPPEDVMDNPIYGRVVA